MNSRSCSAFCGRAFACWNWKCALLSATARSIVYLAAIARSGVTGGISIILVEIVYVTLTAGIYAGVQQRALQFRPRILGNLSIVLGVPMLAQLVDWLAHRVTGAVAPGSANLAVCIFAAVSALFHLHVMRRGAFLTGSKSQTLRDDLRSMPRLIAAFVLLPVAFFSAPSARVAAAAESEAAL
jgi:hypothetical protein